VLGVCLLDGVLCHKKIFSAPNVKKVRQNPNSVLNTPNQLNNEYYRDSGTQVPSLTADLCSNVPSSHTPEDHTTHTIRFS
jgi:hypothetical protein